MSAKEWSVFTFDINWITENKLHDKPDMYLPQELHSLESHKLFEGYSLPMKMFNKFEALCYCYILHESQSYIKSYCCNKLTCSGNALKPKSEIFIFPRESSKRFSGCTRQRRKLEEIMIRITDKFAYPTQCKPLNLYDKLPCCGNNLHHQ